MPDMSDKRFNENIAFFNKLAEDLKAARGAKKTRKSNSQAIKIRNKDIEDCTIDDVK
jgi:hypothetical protein